MCSVSLMHATLAPYYYILYTMFVHYCEVAEAGHYADAYQ